MTGDTSDGRSLEGSSSAPLRLRAAPSRPTLDDVARRAGVSAATASRALGEHPHVAAATRERVREAAAVLDYVASPEASRLAGGVTRRVAVLVPHPSRWFFGELIEGLEAELREAELDLLLFRVGGPEERSAFFAKLPARRKVDAVVVLAFAVDEQEQSRLASLGVGVVAAGGRVASYPSVGIDDHLVGRQAVDHLLHLGHRRIGVLALTDERRLSPDPDGRLSAWRAALREAGIEPDEDLVVSVPWGGEGGAAGMERLLGLRTPPTAVFAHCDETALGALRTLRRTGLRVPEDMSLIGVDDHPLAALSDLTTVAQPVREQGRRAGALVRAALDGGPGSGRGTGTASRVPPSESLPTRLVLRGTTSPPGGPR